MIEEWKEVEGYEGFYEVSNFGNVRSKDRKIFSENQFSKYSYDFSGKTMAPVDNGTGYMQINLSKKGKINKEYVHRLVYKTFIGEIPKNKEINHIDHDKSNNRLNNLEIVSRKENMEKMSMFYSHKKRKENPELFECKICKGPKTPEKGVEICVKCYKKERRGGIDIPEYKVLKDMVEKIGVVNTSRYYSVSHTTIRRWINRHKSK